jgi:hypothetical protein
MDFTISNQFRFCEESELTGINGGGKASDFLYKAAVISFEIAGGALAIAAAVPVTAPVAGGVAVCATNVGIIFGITGITMDFMGK